MALSTAQALLAWAAAKLAIDFPPSFPDDATAKGHQISWREMIEQHPWVTEDVFRRSKERVKLESEVLDQKYEIFAGKGQDANWLRRLFAPTFIVWLTEQAPPKFAFELVGGNLCCYVNGHEENAAVLDRIRGATTAVATRLREETLE
jgi:hypothetical protein